MRNSFLKLFKTCLLIFIFGLIATKILAATNLDPLEDREEEELLYDLYPWSVMYYYGVTGNNALIQLFQGKFHRWPEYIQSVEIEKTLAINNPVRRFFSPLVGVVQLAGNATIRKGSNQSTIYEFEPYLFFRWDNFPWKDYLNTSVGLGEGVSYTTSVPNIEKQGNQNTKRFLNYLTFEATFADPSFPQLQFVTRIHHRSGAFGLYHAGNSGSNDIGVGIRYLFD